MLLEKIHKLQKVLYFDYLPGAAKYKPLMHVMDQNLHVQRHSVKAVVGDTDAQRMIQNVSR